MAKKLLAPNTTIWWIPTAGLANPAAPTAALINAGTNISCAIVTGYSLNFTDSDTDDTKSICDNANVQTPTNDNYEANLTLFRSDLVVPTALLASVFTLFKKAGAQGYLVRRIGKPNAAAAAIGDVVQVFGVESDLPQVVESDNNGPIQMTVPFIPTGAAYNNFKLVA